MAKLGTFIIYYGDCFRFGNDRKHTFVANKPTNENSITNSRGGVTRYSDKLLPGISPFIYGKYMLQNVVNVRLKDV